MTDLEIFRKILRKNHLQINIKIAKDYPMILKHSVYHAISYHILAFNGEGVLCDMESKNSSGNEFLIGTLYRALTLRAAFTIV